MAPRREIRIGCVILFETCCFLGIIRVPLLIMSRIACIMPKCINCQETGLKQTFEHVVCPSKNNKMNGFQLQYVMTNKGYITAQFCILLAKNIMRRPLPKKGTLIQQKRSPSVPKPFWEQCTLDQGSISRQNTVKNPAKLYDDALV